MPKTPSESFTRDGFVIVSYTCSSGNNTTTINSRRAVSFASSARIGNASHVCTTLCACWLAVAALLLTSYRPVVAAVKGKTTHTMMMTTQRNGGVSRSVARPVPVAHVQIGKVHVRIRRGSLMKRWRSLAWCWWWWPRCMRACGFEVV